MSRLTAPAVVAAAVLSTIALTDAVTFGLTGEPSAASDASGVTGLWAFVGAAHAVAYLLFVALLVTRGPAIDGGSRARRVVRWSLVVALVFLAVGMLGQTVAGLVTGTVHEPPGVVGALVGVSFLWMFLGSALLGLLLLRRPGLRVAAWTLAGVLPALGLAMLLGLLGSAWAHPAYPEVLSAFGLAFVGLAPRHQADPRGLGEVSSRIPDRAGSRA